MKKMGGKEAKYLGETLQDPAKSAAPATEASRELTQTEQPSPYVIDLGRTSGEVSNELSRSNDETQNSHFVGLRIPLGPEIAAGAPIHTGPNDEDTLALPTWPDHDSPNIAEDEDDRHSVMSTESSITLVSIYSGITMVGLESATAELQKIFQQDPDLVRLYRRAIRDTAIGPERLQRKACELLKTFARNLRHEASKELEKMTCRFVSTKASYIAHIIVEELNDTPLNQQPYLNGTEQKHDDGTDGQDRYDQSRVENLDDLAPVDEDLFEDIPSLRFFLVNSVAFANFREELTKFVLPKELGHPSNIGVEPETAVNTMLYSRWHLPYSIAYAMESVFIATGCLEPPLQRDMIRLRWICVSRKA
ncbi:hypothetical protein N0V86_001003 [Didymella sp. IMI 355093]|nr:hypothetical protein N0V86_001003 [Didymella sp. IMI 355093]